MARTKADISTYMRAWNKRNKERLSIIRKERYIKNREKRLANQKEYYNKNKDRIADKWRNEMTKEEYNKKQREKYHANKERHVAARKRYFTKYPDRIKNSKLKSRYKITLDEYMLMFNEQEGRCAICDKHQTELSSRLNVDHDHSSDKVRALLCNKCNLILAHAMDNPDLLQASINYLNKFASETEITLPDSLPDCLEEPES